MTLSLLVFTSIVTALFSMIFVPIFATAWWQEEEHWKRQKRQFAAIPVLDDRRW